MLSIVKFILSLSKTEKKINKCLCRGIYYAKYYGGGGGGGGKKKAGLGKKIKKGKEKGRKIHEKKKKKALKCTFLDYKL